MARAIECLLRLFPHLGSGGTAVTGGLAIHFHCQGAGYLPAIRCARCYESCSAAFPLARKEDILALLAYV